MLKKTLNKIVQIKKELSAKAEPTDVNLQEVNSQSNKDQLSTSIKSLYRHMSDEVLGLAVKPQLVGELPDINSVTDENTLTFYVLQGYSRSNSILIDSQSESHNLPPALVQVTHSKFAINEKAGIIFLHHPKAKQDNPYANASPRLQRLITAVQKNPELKVNLIPVTILWGRAPEKEDSIFKLLVADNWQDPNISKQLFNIGIMGRDTFVEFHPIQDLRELINNSHEITDTKIISDGSLTDTGKRSQAGKSSQREVKNISRLKLTLSVQGILKTYLDKRRTSILGPDLSDKRNVIDKLLYTPAIKAAIEEESKASNKSTSQVQQTARLYLQEIASDYSYPIVRFFENFLNWLWTQLYDGVEVKNFDRVRELATDHELIYVPSHRSHVDYLLLSYIIHTQGLRIPYVAAGDNLNMPILGSILRRGGAFFMRRSFKDNALYSSIFKEYMHSIIKRNTPLKYFIEGGRSRSGRLLPPKLGMISMTVQSHLRKAGKPVVFIPTYIGYERIMEGGTYIGELKGKPKESESIVGLLKTGRKLERIFGTVHVNFGSPLYLDDFMTKFGVEANSLPADKTNFTLNDKTQDMVSNIGIKILQNINKAAVINPISLLSIVLLSSPKSALDEVTCLEQLALYQESIKLLPYDDDIFVTEMQPKDIIEYGIQLKLIERIPHILGNMIQVAQNQSALLSYFRNNILHVFISSSFLAAIIHRNGKIKKSTIEDIFVQLYPFLQAELFLKFPQRKVKEVIKNKLNKLVEQGLAIDLDDKQISAPDKYSSKYQQLKMLSTPIEQSLERYIMTITLLSHQGSGKLTTDQVVDLSHLLGQRVSVLYADDIPDAFDRSLFSSFIDALIRLEYISKEAETGVLLFDQRIHEIAKNSGYILSVDILHILDHIASLDEENIKRVITELHEKKKNRFRKKKR